MFIYLVFLFKGNGKKEHLNDDYETHWHWHLKDILQLKILQTWINIHANSFLGKYHEIKMGEGAVEIISVAQKSEPVLWKKLHQDISLLIVLCLENKPSL